VNIYFITGNKGKFEELNSIIPLVVQKDIDLPELQEINPQKIIEEKLKVAFLHIKGKCIVEDTSLYINDLKGLPGPLIKWFLKTVGNRGIANMAYKLTSRKAVAKTVIGYAKNIHETHFFEGSIEGVIVKPRGDKGFGWDSIFQPIGQTKTFAEMTLEEKKEFSMRKIATLKLKSYLASTNSF
jgi:non-canonical purine NTP pyrophosphatase (RdgB/HAM1 family)